MLQSIERWNEVAAKYADGIEGGYHGHGVEVVRLL
jgi:hypothetical protein